jgi:kinesin family protein 11
MQGGDDSSAELSAAAGVIPRAVHQIFCYLDSINSEYTVKCSFLELYNEEITDLLVLGNDTPKVRTQ